MSKPFLCECGSLLNVDEIPPGGFFRCPDCGIVRSLEASDPGLLDEHAQPDGVYDMLLRRRMATETQLPAAIPVSASEASSSTGAVPTETEIAPSGPGQTAIVPSPNPSGVNSPKLKQGEALGPYKIEEILGQGGMGTVYQAFDTSLHRVVALKVLDDEHARNVEVVDRFQREARAAGSLTHPNITHIYSIGEQRGFNYFAMELVRGSTLSDLLKQQERISEELAIDYLLQVARGLRAAKQKEIIHRDIKPSNLILSEDGLIKITDFGLAKVVTSSIDITATGVIVGTPLYMSPEQGKGETLDHRSDIYSLGCTFYHLLAGTPPFTGDSAMNIIVSHITQPPPRLDLGGSAVAGRLSSIIERMIMKNALDRYQCYDSLIEAVSNAATAGSSSSRIEGTPGRIVILSEQADEGVPEDSMSRKQLSVADVNLELGRHDKALSLYQRVLDDNPHLEIDLSFRMLQIHQQQGDEAKAQELYRRILELSADPTERFFCRWKLLTNHGERSLQEVRQAREMLEQLLGDEVPSAVRPKRLQQRLDTLQQLEKKLARDQAAGITLIRKTGDLQIELQ